MDLFPCVFFDITRTVEPRAPKLSYAVAHDKGTIWCLEWCPSGCYEHPSLVNPDETVEDSRMKRMGLLAAACSDGCVHVFSLPFPEELQSTTNENSDAKNNLQIYKAEPILTLVVNTSTYDMGEQNWQCTKLSWSKELGHE